MYSSITEKTTFWNIDATLLKITRKINNENAKIVDIHYFTLEKDNVIIVVVYEK